MILTMVLIIVGFHVIFRKTIDRPFDIGLLIQSRVNDAELHCSITHIKCSL